MNSLDDKPANVAVALDLIDRAAAGGARLVALPEIWPFFGDDSSSRENAETIPGPLTDVLADRAVRHGIYLHAGTWQEARPGDPRMYNTAVVFSPSGEIIGKYSKIRCSTSKSTGWLRTVNRRRLLRVMRS
ncbi:MAG: nitrilase-related carbon-nitrogen hydrolase [Thermomicrobiales bacterium]